MHTILVKYFCNVVLLLQLKYKTYSMCAFWCSMSGMLTYYVRAVKYIWQKTVRVLVFICMRFVFESLLKIGFKNC